MDEVTKQHLLLGREHYAKREYDRAEDHLLEVLKVTRAFADVFNMLGVIHHDRGDFQESRKHFEAAVDLNPNYTEAAMNLAVTYNDLGLYDDAQRVYTMIRRRNAADGDREIDPFTRGKLANLHADVAQVYADLNLWSSAAEEYRKALNLCPQFADLRTRLGSVLRDSGDLEGARKEYEAAIAANGRYFPARILLGICLVSLGKRDEAEAQWQQVLDLDPSNRSAQMYLRMVRSNVLKTGSVPSMKAVRPETLNFDEENTPDEKK